MYWHTLGIKWSNHVPKNVIITCASVTHEIFISCICGKCSDVMCAMIYWDILRKNTEMFNFVTYQLWWIYSFLVEQSSVVCEDVMYDMMARRCKRNATGYLDGSVIVHIMSEKTAALIKCWRHVRYLVLDWQLNKNKMQDLLARCVTLTVMWIQHNEQAVVPRWWMCEWQPGNWQAWSLARTRGQWRTGKNEENWLQNHLRCPNDPHG